MLSKIYNTALVLTAAVLNAIPGVAATASPYADLVIPQDGEPVQHTGETWAEAATASTGGAIVAVDPTSANTNQA